MIININDKDYELKTTLGTVREMERNLGLGFIKIVDKFESLQIGELQRLLICGLANKPTSKEKEEFKNDLDTCGLEEFYTIVSKFFAKIQNPKLTDEELNKTIEENKKAIDSGKK